MTQSKRNSILMSLILRQEWNLEEIENVSLSSVKRVLQHNNLFGRVVIKKPSRSTKNKGGSLA